MIPILLALLLEVSSSRNAALPVSATIVDKFTSPASNDVFAYGNVLVTFSDGHHEKWTKKGHALIPHVSSNGLVGWAKFEELGFRGMPVDDTLRVCTPDGQHHDFGPFRSYIEEWAFSDGGRSVIIKSRNSHGPASYDKFDTMTGKMLDDDRGRIGIDLPAWAKPFSD